MNAFSSENVARLQMAFGHQADSLTNLPPFKGARPDYEPNVLPLFHHLPALFHFLVFLHLVPLFYRSFVHSFNPSVMYTIIQSVRFFALCSFIRLFVHSFILEPPVWQQKQTLFRFFINTSILGPIS